MILNVVSCFDSKAKAWTVPAFIPSTQSIEREWANVVNDPSSMFNKHPDDYTLFHLGTWDPHRGVFEMFSSKESIGLALNFIR